MATSSEVKAGLDDISTIIRTERQAIKNAVARIGTALANLNGLTTSYAGVIATVQAFGNADDFEKLAKAELAKMTSEFTALKAKVTTAANGLAAIDFST